MKVLLVYKQENSCFKEHHFVSFLKQMMIGCSEEVMVSSGELPDHLECDLIVMIGNVCTALFHEQRYGHIPVVLFVTNARENVHIPRLKNIAWVFFIDNAPVEYTDFIRELCSVTPIPVCSAQTAGRNNKKLTDDKRNIAFIGDTTGLYPLKQVITAFNELEVHKLWMFVKEAHINILKDYANNGVQIKSIDQYPQFLDRIDLAVTSGPSAVDVLFNRIPAVVVGDSGFGGLVSINNIHAHCKQSFSGRIGGSKGERIPVELVLAELEWANKRLLEEPAFTEPMAAMVQEWFDEEKIKKCIVNRIYGAEAFHRRLYSNKTECLHMIPMRTEDITIRKAGGTVVLCNPGSKRKIMELQEEEFVFLYLINGQRSIEDLLAVFGNDTDVTNILAFIRSLWEEKIIYFKH